MAEMVYGELTSYNATLFSKMGDTRAQMLLISEAANAVCYLTFFTDSVTLPDNRLVYQGATRQIYVSMRYSDYANVIDLARNEKPLSFFYRDDVKLFYVTSSREPIGEQEGI